MPLTYRDVIPLRNYVSEDVVKRAAATCLHLLSHVRDRPDLHGRDPLERYVNLLMGEIAEMGVLAYLHSEGKYAVSAVDKTSRQPDLGHDILVTRLDGTEAKCSVKSSLSVYKKIEEIPGNFRPAFNNREPRDVNIQVYFHYCLNDEPRTTVLSSAHAYIIGWLPEKKLLEAGFTTYRGQQRKASHMHLSDMFPMPELLQSLKEKQGD